MHKRSTLAASLCGLSLPLCLAVFNPAIAAITIDGQASDWSETDRLDLPPATTVSGYQLYGRYESNTYKIMLKASSQIIGAKTTLWLDTDQNINTGYKIFGFAGGTEYNVTFAADGKPYLYTGGPGETQVLGPLNYAISTSGTGSTLEIEIPEAQIGTPTAAGINLLLDVNDTVFLPTYYSATNQYVLKKQTTTLPAAKSATERRIGIVYSQTSANRFWDTKNYAQLFMSMQAQAMMAGVPFDLLSEDDLTDLNKMVKYDTLIFPYFAYVPTDKAATIEQNLYLASSKYKVGIITAGNFMTNKADGSGMDGDSYARMKTLLGISRVNGSGPVNVAVKVSNVTHPLFKGEYTAGETVLNYTGAYTDYFAASGSTAVTTLATQTLGTSTQNAVLASEVGGRNVHFGTVGMMADSNMLWSAIRWSVFGTTPLAGVQLGRDKALFISRNDMDQSMYTTETTSVEVPLLTYLKQWKTNYNFVGSYYINVGNNPTAGEAINWTTSKPLYQSYMALGNEMGTHSYTHPADTNLLTPDQIKFEFADSRSIIEQNLGLSNIGAAVPGAPEKLAISQEIIKHVSYLSGGYSGVGAGFPNAIGYLTPSDTKVYLSPNMSFDFTLIEFKGMSATQAQAQWFTEFDNLTKHAKRAMIHWPWHDYGPINPDNKGYTVAMFTNFLSKAATYGSEFVTADDFRQRIEAFRNMHLDVSQPDASTVNVNVQASNAGRFGIDIPQASGGKKIQSVTGWYAYNDNQVFSDQDGGTYTVKLGTTVDAATHITQMPARGNLISLSGDGRNLSFSFAGEGKMTVQTKCMTLPLVTGASSYTYDLLSKNITLNFTNNSTYNVKVTTACL